MLPNLKPNELDLELYQEDSQQFMLNYFEQSVQMDRREATVQLLQQITKKYPNES